MISALLTVIAVVATHYYVFLLKILRGLKSLSLQNNSNNSKPVFKKVSLIIPFRNEEASILQSLESIQCQQFDENKLEVLYINDSSTDQSPSLLSDNIKSRHIKMLTIPESYSSGSHKKRAVRFGIENSTGDIIMTTDADCVHPREWISTMLSEMDQNTMFLSGPVIFSEENTSFNHFQKMEFAGLVLAGAGLIGSGTPIICNAANIAYRRTAYEQVNGFEYKHSLASGDDELLMQKISKEKPGTIKFCMNKGALVKTAANKTVGEFYNQRKRWASKGLFYSDKSLILKLILIFLFYLSMPIQLVLGFIQPVYLAALTITFTIKIFLEYRILNTGKQVLYPEGFPGSFILTEILHIPYIIIAGASGVFGNYNWKGRKIKR